MKLGIQDRDTRRLMKEESQDTHAGLWESFTGQEVGVEGAWGRDLGTEMTQRLVGSGDQVC